MYVYKWKVTHIFQTSLVSVSQIMQHMYNYPTLYGFLF